MCGIVGFGGTDQIKSFSWFLSAQDSIIHRGPDDFGEWWSDDNRVGLAHRRLSIIDLSPLGHQPMHFLEKGLTIVFNGEIYNFIELRNELIKLGYLFKSQSDTEVLSAAYAEWGDKCLSRLNGMFAFAIYDERKKELFLARDRAGEKPLFYRIDNGTIYFASELKALLANPNLPKNLNWEALDCYLAMGFVPGNLCILEGYNKLPPGHALKFDLNTGDTKIWKYWTLPELDSNFSALNENRLLDELEKLLEDAVKKQLVADVPVGILLSGGLDSSLITALAVRNSAKIKTFSIRFPGHGVLDETIHSRLIAKHFKTDHLELIADPSSADLFPILARQFDEPIVDSSMIPTWLVSKLVKKYCSVALGGDGGDELFGGYNHYNRLLWMEKNINLIPFWLRKLISKSAENIIPNGFKGRNYLQGLNTDFNSGLPLIASYFDSTTRKQLLKGYDNYKFVAEKIYKDRIPINIDLLQRATRIDFENYLPEDILVKVDRASMINSLEIRAPFLDYRIIEFAFGKVPSYLKANQKNKKILLKKLAEKILPNEFEKNRKQGFSIPMSQWLKKGPFRDLIWDVLNSKNCMFDRKEVDKLLKGQDSGFNNGERLFALVLFELWRNEYKITI